MRYSIDTGKVGDIDNIVDFQLEMAQETENITLNEETVTLGVRSVMNDPSKGLYLVARDEEGAAVASLMITKEWSDWRASWYWWIQSVFVKKEHRGNGIFKSLYREAVRLAHEDNSKEIRLYVENSNKTAQETYKKVGMKESHYLMYDHSLT